MSALCSGVGVILVGVALPFAISRHFLTAPCDMEFSSLHGIYLRDYNMGAPPLSVGHLVGHSSGVRRVSSKECLPLSLSVLRHSVQ